MNQMIARKKYFAAMDYNKMCFFQDNKMSICMNYVVQLRGG